MPVDVQGTFVSQKINKIRWIPEEYTETKHFFTGSWDDDQNSVKVWTFESPESDEDVEYPRQLSEFKVDGDVTEMKYTQWSGGPTIAVSSSDGQVRLFQFSYDKFNLEAPLDVVSTWDNLHKYGETQCSCTSLDTMESEIATVGEDGNIFILNVRTSAITRSIEGADSCSLHSVCFIKLNEIITGNIRGHMKIWDIRSNSNKPSASFLLAGDELAATCIVRHPTQPHIILAGSESGSLALWDLRMNQFPTSLLNAHASGVTEMQFHPENPNKLLTCSLSGEVWDWNVESLTKKTAENWMPLDDKNPMPVNSLMPTLHKSINTINCDKGRILCGADNEAIYLIKNFKY